MSIIRTFVAVDVAPGIRAAAAKQILALQKLGIDGYNWVEPEEMHITLKFIGNIQDNEAPEVCSLVHNAVKNCEAISLKVQGLGAFPDENRPRTLWMGITDGLDEFRVLQKQVDEAMHKMGFPLERNEFTPHITLARLPRGAHGDRIVSEYIANNRETPIGGFDVDQVIVYSSFKDRGSRTYTPMATVDLEG